MHRAVCQYLQINQDILIQFESTYSNDNDLIININIGKDNQAKN